MNTIKLLDKNTIDKIAAGEVVERPSSVVKELCENSIDAGATSISVEIRYGGKSLMRITDNGSGIEKEQIANAFLRHSTSKINSASDLPFIMTLGFRGEALSSIAAVSKLELCTKTKDSLTGSIYKIDGGQEKELIDAGLPDGTTIIIKDIFFNTPARLKFLKSSSTEAGYVEDVVEKLALSHPDIAFKYTNNGSLKISTTGNGALKDCIYAVFGKDITSRIIEINSSDDILSINGFIGKPEISRGNRNFEIYFINGRFIKDRVIEKAIEEAYKGRQMKGTFPLTVFNIAIEPELVDVNVHPSKMEVRFFNNETIFNSVFKMISEALNKRETIPDILFSTDKKIPHATEKKTIEEPFEKKSSGKFNPENKKSCDTDTTLKFLESLFVLESCPEEIKVAESNSQYKTDHDTTQNIINDAQSTEPIPADSVSPASGAECDLAQNISNDTESAGPISADFGRPACGAECDMPQNILNGAKQQIEQIFDNKHVFDKQLSVFEDGFLSDSARKKHRIIGEIFDTYWLVEYDSKLYIIDQHAAHEKVMYEKLLNNIKTEKHFSQKIFPVIILTLSQSEENVLNKFEDQFRLIGFETEHYGGREYAITSIPSDLYGLENTELFLNMLDELSSIGNAQPSDILLKKIAAAACKAAVKGGKKLSAFEANALIDSLLKLENPYNCPHGRPTIVSMSKQELEKKFNIII